MIIETSCFLFKPELENLGVNSEVEAKIIIDSAEIKWARELIDEVGQVYKNRCLIYFKSGDSIEIKEKLQYISNILKTIS